MAACAGAKGPPQAPGLRALFRAGPTHYAASDPQAGWYAPAEPVQFTQTGPAAVHGDPYARRKGVGGWLSRLFRRKPTATEVPAAIAPQGGGLPVPAYAYVTNVQTFATVRVRVDQRAPMGKAVISLSEPTARLLGGEPGRPLTVRVRYAAPVVAYREGGSVLRTAFRRPSKRDVQLAAAPSPPPTVVAAPRPAPAVDAAKPAAAVAQAVPPPALRPAIPLPALRIQAGAFANPKNAERAVALLAPAGVARIEPVQVGETTLYRVWLRAPADRAQAEALRARVAQIGFLDARVVRAG